MMLTHAAVHASQFWPDIARGCSAAAAVASSVAAILGARNRSRLQEVHVLLNGELHGKIQELATVADQLRQVTIERDQAKAAGIGGRRATDHPDRGSSKAQP